jgi:DNA polymerase I-like protein with 3'-5' exonuclease and polymerase domains
VVDALSKTNAVIIGQNLKFDQQWLLHHYGLELSKIFDTFRASTLIHNGKRIGHGLWDLYSRELGIVSEAQDLGGSDWSGSLTPEQLFYSADDAHWLPALREKLKPQLAANGLNKTALIEFQVILAEAALENTGFRLDSEMWLNLYERNNIQRAALEAELLYRLPHPEGQLGLFSEGAHWNLSSTQQLIKSLARLGIELESTDEDSLAAAASRDPVLLQVIAHRKVSKLCSSFGPDYLGNIDAITGRVHASFYPFTGAGRYSCLVPETPVRTARGLVSLGEVVVGDLVWTHKQRWREVTAFLDQGLREVHKVVLGDGRELTCTGDHRILKFVGSSEPLEGDWITVKDLYIQSLHSGLNYALAGSLGACYLVDSVSYAGERRVYDLSVLEDESYETYGVFSHNCSKPNLQQIPRLKDFRKCFRPLPGKKLIIADYSQVELRIAAQISGDEKMIQAYNQGQDLHKLTAAWTNEVSVADVTSEMRQLSKAINFGLVFGMGAEQLVIYAFSSYGVVLTLNQARQFRAKYFKAYEGVNAWQQKTFRQIKPKGVVRTLSGRLRYLEANAHNEYLNSQVQGTGADGLKRALRILYDRLKCYGGRARIVHMVHDEIAIEADDEPEFLVQVRADLERSMIEGMSEFITKVPIVVDSGVGCSWAEKG